MKVLVITNRFPAISTPFILNLVTGLVDQDVKVTVVSLEKGEEGPHHKQYYQYSDQFDLIEKPAVPASYYKRVWYLIRALSYFMFTDFSIFLLCLKSLFRGRFGISLRYIYDIRFFYSLREFDLGHAQFGPIGALLVDLKNDGVLKFPIITHFRGYDIQKIFNYRPQNLYENLFKSGTYFLANCEYFRAKLIRMGVPPEKIEVLYSGIDDNFFNQFKQIINLQNATIQLCSVGRLTGKKGLEYSIRAVAQIIALRPDLSIRYTIIGEGELRKSLEELVDSLNLQSQVVFLGAKNHSFILEYLLTQDIFLSHNIKTEDGDEDAPVNVIKEAYLLKLPVVSTWHGGIPELVQDGISGYLVPEKNIAEMCVSILDLIDNPERRMQFGEAGYRIVKENFTNALINKKLLAIYHKVLNSN